MRISSIAGLHVAAPLKEALPGSARRAALRARESLIVRVASDDGLVGYGECTGPPAVLRAAVRHLASAVLGADPQQRTVLAERLFARAREEGPESILMAAAGGIDLALWDLNAKALAVPLSVLLGGPVRSTVPAYAASIYFAPLDQAVRMARKFVGAGFGAIKMKIGLGLEEDLERIAAIRQAVGTKTRLLLDANGAFDAKTAITLAHQAAPYNIHWFEDPVPAYDLEGSVTVRRAIGMPVAGGEALYTRYGFTPWLTRQALDVAMPDLGRCGGLTEAWAIAAVASACRIAISPHCWGMSIALAASVHFAAALPHCAMIEFDAYPNPLREALMNTQLEPREGGIPLPDGSGLGVEVSEDALRELAISTCEEGE